jgi:hypothetical protein
LGRPNRESGARNPNALSLWDRLEAAPIPTSGCVPGSIELGLVRHHAFFLFRKGRLLWN